MKKNIATINRDNYELVMIDKIYSTEEANAVIFRGIILQGGSKERYQTTRRVLVFRGQIANIEVGAIYAIEAQAVPDTQYDYLYEVINAELLESAPYAALRSFILRCEAVTPKRARLLLERYGTEVLHEIVHNDDALDFLELPTKARGNLHIFAEQHLLFDAILHLLMQYKMDCRLTAKVFDLYRKIPVDKVMTSITDNPYTLFIDSVCSFNESDALYLRMKNPADSGMRCRYAILGALQAAAENGSTCIARKDIRKAVWKLLKQTEGATDSQKNAFAPKAISEAITRLKERDLICWDSVGNADGVYLRDHCIEEKSVAKYLFEAISGFKFLYFERNQVEQFLADYDSSGGIVLDDLQKDAVRRALLTPVSIITGGPGTGKTQTLQAICAAVSYFFPDAEIRCCAPTGKAASRMEEATGLKSKTIHRLLRMGSAKGPLGYQELECDYVIVDESTMADTQLMSMLLFALSPSARLVLVGDVNQLPSVRPGRVFADLIASEAVPVTTLTKVYRQANGSNITANYQAIVNQKPGQDIVWTQSTSAGGDFYFFQREDIYETLDVITESYRQAREDGVPSESIVVLTAGHDGELGEANLNKVLQQEINPDAGAYFQSEGREFRVGDPVRHTRNNYDLEVMNGETGVVEGILEDTLIVRYPGNRAVKYQAGDLVELELAYAITVHQAQGSEWPVVLIPVSRVGMLSKNLLYTAMSRGKELVIMAGNKSLLATGMRYENRRRTLLTERIRYKLAQQAWRDAHEDAPTGQVLALAG